MVPPFRTIGPSHRIADELYTKDENPAAVTIILTSLIEEFKKADIKTISVESLEEAVNKITVKG